MGLVKSQSRALDGSRRRARDRGTAVLVAGLSADDAETRRCAALDLRGRHDAIPALLAAYSTERVAAVREALLITLAEHDDPEVADALAEELRCDDAAVRNAAVTGLWSMPNAVAGLVDQLVNDPQERVRILAMAIFSGVEHPEVPRWLDGVVRTEPSENVVAAAVDAAITAGADPHGLLELARRRFPTNPYLAWIADTLVDAP